MESQKSSKKISVIVAILILVSGLIIGSYLILQSRITKANLFEQMSQTIQDQKIIDDLDFDGLNGWEENLHKTDPENPDTDGDGYFDGEEVATGYDPTKPSPYDKLDSNTNSQLSRPEPGNLSQMLGYVMGNQIKFDLPFLINSKNTPEQSEQILDAKIVEALQKSSTNFMAEFIPDFNKIDIKVTDNKKETVKKYLGNMKDKIGPLESCQDPNNIIDDIDFVQEAINTKNFSQINCLADAYINFYKVIKEINPPSNWLDFHVNILEIFWNFSKVYENLPNLYNDPLKGLIVLEKFEQINEDFINLLEEMSFLLETQQ